MQVYDLFNGQTVGDDVVDIGINNIYKTCCTAKNQYVTPIIGVGALK